MTKKANDPSSPSRRRFVVCATTLMAGSAGFARHAHAAGARSNAACKSPGCEYDVVVVGGGYAGTAAARDCMENGYRTLLLEARNRLGGRTFTAEFEGVPIELGGTWIHHTQPFVWAEKERYGLEVVETPGAVADTSYVITGGKRTRLSESQSYEIVNAWQTYHATAREIVPRAWDLLYNRDAALAADKINAVEHLDRLDLPPLPHNYVKALIATMANNHPENMSYLEVMRWHLAGGGFLPTVMDSIARFKLKDGTISLVDKMTEDGGAEVRLSTPVKAVRDLGDKAMVTTSRGEEISCGAVISCLPMNTVANVNFQPGLPTGVMEAGKERHAGAGFKLFMKVKGNVGNVVTVATGSPLDYTMTYKQAEDYTILVAFGRGPELLDVYDDIAVQNVLRVHLPGANLLSTMSYDWNNDPYAQGTWAVYRPGWVGKYYDQFQQDYGRILFGSGDHGEGWRGFIDGAIGSGIKAAQRAKVLLG